MPKKRRGSGLSVRKGAKKLKKTSDTPPAVWPATPPISEGKWEFLRTPPIPPGKDHGEFFPPVPPSLSRTSSSASVDSVVSVGKLFKKIRDIEIVSSTTDDSVVSDGSVTSTDSRGKRRRRGGTRFTHKKKSRVPTPNFDPVQFTIARASIHQGNSRFSGNSRNKQCTACAVIAAAHAVHQPPTEGELWTEVQMNSIIVAGDDLYQRSVAMRDPAVVHEYLQVSEVHVHFNLVSSEQVLVHFDDLTTVDGWLIDSSEPAFPCLADSLPSLFTNFASAVITCQSLACAIWHIPSAGSFGLFDSHARDERGLPTADGDSKACLLLFTSAADLVSHLVNIFRLSGATPTTQYSLAPLRFEFTTPSISAVGEGHSIPHVIRDSPDDIPRPEIVDLGSVNLRSTKVTKKAAISAKKHCQKPFSLGLTCQSCVHCGATFFKTEVAICCNKGTVRIAPLTEYPERLADLLQPGDLRHDHFMCNIMKYNNMVSFASLSATLRPDLMPGVPVYVISGQIRHRISDIDPIRPRFGSLYFLDPAEAMDARSRNPLSKECRMDILRLLDGELRRVNPFVHAYQSLRRVYEDTQRNALALGLRVPRLGLRFASELAANVDRRVYSAPSCSDEVAVVFESRDGLPPPPADIRVYMPSDDGEYTLHDISRLSPVADPLCYALLFPSGDFGWAIDIPVNADASNRDSRTRVSMCEFYQYRIADRPTRFNPILRAGRLTQQFIVDAFLKVEGDRLHFFRTHQQRIRAETLYGLTDYVRTRGERDGVPAGRCVILPCTFTGGPRYMLAGYRDAMAIVARYGKPTLFITFTCNPKWPEITHKLTGNLKAQDRPELVARVFNLKHRELLEDITKRRIFGEVTAYFSVIEFQKRGLPHAHILITLSDIDRPREPDAVDDIITAELPCVDQDSALHNLVLTHMIHGPCGDRFPSCVCMVDGRCSKRFPKEFVEETVVEAGQYPRYRRRPQVPVSSSAFVSRRNQIIPVDNRDVVPYNPYLLSKFNCHINVELCSSVSQCKYIFKYTTKGPDHARFEVVQDGDLAYDEVEQYVDTRFIGSVEAVWRLLNLNVIKKSHSVTRLPIHLPGQQLVHFVVGQEEQAILQQEGHKSMLEKYFDLNAEDVNARKLSYTDIPLHYLWLNGKWNKRTYKTGVIPRMYVVSPAQSELFYLRILLLHVRGACSFDDLKVVGGAHCGTFREAAAKRLLLESDEEYYRVLQYVVDTETSAAKIRRIFALLLCNCSIRDPQAMWHRFQEDMSKDFAQRFHLSGGAAVRQALHALKRFMERLGRNLAEFGFVEPAEDSETIDDVVDNDASPLPVAQVDCEASVALLNPEQRVVYDVIMASVHSDSIVGRVFYLQGAGGTGKTFLYNLLINILHERGVSTVAVAHTGIAASLLVRGRTAHSTFRLPLRIGADSISAISPSSEEGQRLRRVQLLIWDEISLTSYCAIDTVDRLFRELHSTPTIPFGGACTVLLGGDVRQLLPVADTQQKQIELCFSNCMAWSQVRILHLRTNVRAGGDADYAEWLLKLGEGQLGVRGSVPLPRDIILVPERCLVDDVVSAVYGVLSDIGSLSADDLMTRAILCPKNDHCTLINEKLTRAMPGEEVTLLSADSFVSEESNDEVPDEFSTEYLNSITPAGMPPHRLVLKTGVPIMLLRNIAISEGLINGTRLMVLSIEETVLRCRIATGVFAGREVFLFRMDLVSEDEQFLFKLRRRQFPVRVCFALTINKSQGQTFERVGLYLPSPVFAHGQLYVAFSRARSWDSVKVEIHGSRRQGQLLRRDSSVFTPNIVYQSVLHALRRR